jgi:hypothetical protein
MSVPTMHEFVEPRPVCVVYEGQLVPAMAIMVTYLGFGMNTEWMVVLDETRQVKHVSSDDIRFIGNPTYGIPEPVLKKMKRVNGKH